MLAGALFAAGPAAARSCPAHKGTLKSSVLGRIWHQGRTLYACSTEGGPRTRRMGPWTPGTRVRFDGFNLVWTTSLERDGERSDRLWARGVLSGPRWLEGAQAVPAAGGDPAREARVQDVFMRDSSAAWVTQSGEVVLALDLPQGDPEPVGTPPGPLEPVDGLLLVGRFDQISPAALASSLRLTAGQGEGDDCGGSSPYTLTVRPDPAGEPVGATWVGGVRASDPTTCNL